MVSRRNVVEYAFSEYSTPWKLYYSRRICTDVHRCAPIHTRVKKCMHALLTKEKKKKKKKKRKKERKKNLCIACKVHRHVAFAVPMAKQGQIWHYRVNPGSALTCKISSRSLHRVAKTPNFTAFQLQHSAVAPTSGAETKLNASAQL